MRHAKPAARRSHAIAAVSKDAACHPRTKQESRRRQSPASVASLAAFA
jgi:hypothetical protein